MNTECPACGSTNTKKRMSTCSVAVPYGPPATYSTAENHCLDCGEDGDFDAQGDNEIEKALDSSKKASIAPMLDFLSEQGVSNAYFERALGLPARTVARWKNGELSASSLALLRIVRTFPWVLEVADEGFTPRAAITSLVRATGAIVGNIVERTTTNRVLDVVSSGNDVTLQASFRVLDPNMEAPQNLSEPKWNFLGMTT